MINRSQTERGWIDWLRGLSSDKRKIALATFCPHYHYFSVHQVIAFTGLFRRISPLERETLAMLGDVLHEELGRGDPTQVHSVLFERFAASTGVNIIGVLPRDEVAPGVRAYVTELERAFMHASMPEAIAAYQFLETSAVETYGPLLEALTDFGFNAKETKFFALHAQVEVEHAAAAEEMFERQEFAKHDEDLHRRQLRVMADLWDEFWASIALHTRKAVDDDAMVGSKQ